MANFPTLTKRPASITPLEFDNVIESDKESGLNHARARYSKIKQKFDVYYHGLKATDFYRLLQHYNDQKGANSFNWQNAYEAYTPILRWQLSTQYEVGDICHPITPTGRSYKRIVAGTSSATAEPTWATATNSLNSDGGVSNCWSENTYQVRYLGQISRKKVEAPDRLDVQFVLREP